MRNNPFDLAQLDLVRKIVDQGSLTAAARQLNISQPALSRRLAQLEQRLGQDVFHRIGKKMQPTAAGRVLLESAQRIIPDLEKTTQLLAELKRGTKGQIRLCIECVTCYHWLPALLNRFHDQYPQVDIDIKPQFTDDPLQALLEGMIDLAICTDGDVPAGLRSEFLFEDQYMAVLPRDHRLAGRAYLNPRDFTDEHVILYSAGHSQFADRFLRPHGVTPARGTSVTLTGAIIEMVKAGLGITVLTNWVYDRQSSPELVAIPLGEGGLSRCWNAVTLPQANTGYLDQFVSLLRQNSPA